MRSSYADIQRSSRLYLIHHSQTIQHFNLIPSLPQHIQVCTYCCLPTQSQPHQLSCRSLTTRSFIKQHTPTPPPSRGCFQCDMMSLFYGLPHIQHAYFFHVPLHRRNKTYCSRHYMKLNNLIYMIQCKRCHKQYLGETKRRLKDRFKDTADQLTSPPAYRNLRWYQNISSLIIAPLMTSHSFYKNLFIPDSTA